MLEQQERIDQQAIELINDNGNTQLLDEIATLEEAMAAKILEVRRLEHAQEGYQARCKVGDFFQILSHVNTILNYASWSVVPFCVDGQCH